MKGTSLEPEGRQRVNRQPEYSGCKFPLPYGGGPFTGAFEAEIGQTAVPDDWGNIP
jgi:hypothetical protein